MELSNKYLLDENSKKIETPSGIKLELKNHQKTILNKLVEIEDNEGINIKNEEELSTEQLSELNVSNNDKTLYTNCGLLCDR